MGGAGRIVSPLLGGLGAAGGLALTAAGNPLLGIPLMTAGLGTGLGSLVGGPGGAAMGGLAGLGAGSQFEAGGGLSGLMNKMQGPGQWPMQTGGFPQPAMAGTQGGVVPQPPTTPQLAQPNIPMGPPLQQPAQAPPTTAPAAAPQISPPGAITPTLQEFAQLLRGLAGPTVVGSM